MFIIVALNKHHTVLIYQHLFLQCIVLSHHMHEIIRQFLLIQQHATKLLSHIDKSGTEKKKQNSVIIALWSNY